MTLSRPFKEDVERFLFSRLSAPGDRWCDVLGFEPRRSAFRPRQTTDTKHVHRGKVYSISCTSTLHRGGHVRYSGLRPFSMQSAPQVLYTVWRTREKHWSTSIQHSQLHRYSTPCGGHVKNTGLPPFSMQPAPQVLHNVWGTREKHWFTSIQHTVSSTGTAHRVEDT